MRRISSLPTSEYDALAQRFWSKVDASGGNDSCWPWTAAVNHERGGYGQFKIGLPEKKTIRTNRMAWILARGDIPDGLHVLHQCDNPPCCNPAHLFLGTIQDNNRDMAAKGRRRSRKYISDRQVEEIVAKTGTATCKELALIYGVSKSLINFIQNGKRRVHHAPHKFTANI
jgi:hypothetical protein